MGGMTWTEYGEGVTGRLADLHDRVHRGPRAPGIVPRTTVTPHLHPQTRIPKPASPNPHPQTRIPKPDGRQRPLGIASLEDKIVQRALVEVLNAIYETDFLGTRHVRGAMIVVRYADDTVVGFEHRTDAERFLASLRQRLGEFALELHPEKTRPYGSVRGAPSDRRP